MPKRVWADLPQRTLRFSVGILLLSASFFPTAQAQTVTQADPEAAVETGAADRKAGTAERFMAVAAHPAAAEAAEDILARGGSAIDAAIAAQMILTLVEPQSSGIGGGGFLVHWDPAARDIATYDGRETAPGTATPQRFQDADGNPRPWPEVVPGGLSVGVPGLVPMLALAHADHGVLPWVELVKPAITLADAGFPVSPRLNGLLTRLGPDFFLPKARAYFFDADGAPRPVGHILKNPDLANTLRSIALSGGKAMREGGIAQDIVLAVKAARVNPGDMTLADLAGYEAKRRPAACSAFRGRQVCGMGPPSSGGLTVGMILGLLDRFPPTDDPALALHRRIEAEKLAYADRGRYMADEDFVWVPSLGLTDPAYLAGRSMMIDDRKAKPPAEPGTPPGAIALRPLDASAETPGTTHLSIVDAEGRAVALTSSIESAFGSRLMVRGFLLNNQLTDFSFRDSRDGEPIANRVEAGKRPRSSMAPTIVLGPDGLEIVTGSPGGSRIIGYVVKSVTALIDDGLTPAAAAALPNVTNRNGSKTAVEPELAGPIKSALEDLGHVLDERAQTSGLHIIQRLPDGRLVGGADPRREGIVLGE
ncbi:MAG: gamma-glutamyltransferase family protein [Alphaproteobacteria bacterium]|nr:gamma-glutamyltransferase family protein [Alphaproteobacteria bacterium]